MARSKSVTRTRDKYGRFKKSRSVTRTKSKSKRGASKKNTRRANSKSKRAKSKSKRAKSKSRSRSRSSSRCSLSQFRSPKSGKCASIKNISEKDIKKYARLLGIRYQKDLKKMVMSMVNKNQFDKLIQGLEKKQKRRRTSGRKAVTKRKLVGGVKEPSYKEVMDHFYIDLQERLYCPKKVCKNVIEEFKSYKLFPRSPEDLQMIFSMPGQDASFKSRCWICMYRAYRDVFYKLNGKFPAADVPDDFVGYSADDLSLLSMADEKLGAIETSFDLSTPISCGSRSTSSKCGESSACTWDEEDSECYDKSLPSEFSGPATPLSPFGVSL